jgi:hypothetical protein
MELWDVDLKSPVHIHTPCTHIGVMYGPSLRQIIPALDVFLFLQDLAKGPIDFWWTYALLSSRMQTNVREAYYH